MPAAKNMYRISCDVANLVVLTKRATFFYTDG